METEDLNKLISKDIEELIVKINPVKDYVKHATTYLQKRLGLSEHEAKSKVINILKKHPRRSPTLKFKKKNRHGDMCIEKSSIQEYLQDVIEDNDIIVPSFTTYCHPDKLKSIHAEYMQHNIKTRSAYKKEAFRQKQEGNLEAFEYNNTLQKSAKILNNSLSGAYSSKSTVLRNPSAHYTLTSITRCVSSVGNAVSESFLAGNKHFKSVDSVYNYITAIISSTSRNNIEYCIKKYNLNIPTVDFIFNNIKECSKWYWNNEEALKDIYQYLTTLDDIERVAVAYTNDFWSLANLNREYVVKLLGNMSKKCNEPFDTKILKVIPEDIFILTKIICADDIKGINLDIDKINGTDIGNMLSSTANNIIQELKTFSKLFHTFYLSTVLPIDIAYIKDMMRDVIILSDTDSTCATYDKWTKWYFGKITMGSEGTSIAAVVMTFNSRVIDHGLKILSKCMNVPKDRADLLKMKNEFYWEVFTTANVNKHYFANTLIQEGNVYKQPELELKGVHLISSSSSQEYVKKLHEMIKEINAKLAKGEKLSLLHYVKYVASLEREILSKIDAGDITIYKNDKIKDADSYKVDDIALTPYIHHLLWKDVFSHKYGYPGEPPYMTIKIPTILDSKKKMTEFLSSIEDETIRNSLQEFCKKYNKEYIGTFRPPISIVSSVGIPKELIPCIDTRRIIKDNMMCGYVVLEALGFYKKTDSVLIDIGY